MDIVLERILAEHVNIIDRHVVSGNLQDTCVQENVENNVVEKTIPLRLSQLAKIKPGMYWYEDNTCSSKLNPTKHVKSIVLLVKGDMVYGDSFEQRYMLGKKISSYLQETSAKLYYPLCRPQAEDLIRLYDERDTVNKALKKLKKLPWTEELYWAEQVSAESGKIVDLFDASELPMSIEQGAYFRPMITFQVK